MQRDNTQDPLFGKVIDNKYEILERIGGGGMGAVYRARHEMMDRFVALKIIHPNLMDSDSFEFHRRFIREAKTSSRIEHANAIPIYDYGVDEGSPYIVMKLIEGQTLTDLLKNNAPLDIQRIHKISEQICSALNAAHSLGIVHRDLKPDNIMISRESDGSEVACVLDFGIAKITSNNGDTLTALTETGKIIGTPKYMSPEQIRGQKLDGRSDIYSLGIILYQMASGEIPFKTNSPADLLVSHLTKSPPPFHQLDPTLNIPNNLEMVVQKALQKERERRHSSVLELASEISAAVENPSYEQLGPIPEVLSIESSLKFKPRDLASFVVGFCIVFLSLGTMGTPSIAKNNIAQNVNLKVEDTSVTFKAMQVDNSKQLEQLLADLTSPAPEQIVRTEKEIFEKRAEKQKVAEQDVAQLVPNTVVLASRTEIENPKLEEATENTIDAEFVGLTPEPVQATKDRTRELISTRLALPLAATTLTRTTERQSSGASTSETPVAPKTDKKNLRKKSFNPNLLGPGRNTFNRRKAPKTPGKINLSLLGTNIGVSKIGNSQRKGKTNSRSARKRR